VTLLISSIAVGGTNAPSVVSQELWEHAQRRRQLHDLRKIRTRFSGE
jgi:hypothetical protein